MLKQRVVTLSRLPTEESKAMLNHVTVRPISGRGEDVH